jgi:hypothetical protein
LLCYELFFCGLVFGAFCVDEIGWEVGVAVGREMQAELVFGA